jgi:hypothetical protein
MPHRRTAAKLIRFAPDELAAVSRRARTCGRTPATRTSDLSKPAGTRLCAGGLALEWDMRAW